MPNTMVFVDNHAAAHMVVQLRRHPCGLVRPVTREKRAFNHLALESIVSQHSSHRRELHDH